MLACCACSMQHVCACDSVKAAANDGAVCRMACRCFWDSETDNYAFESFKNVSAVAATQEMTSTVNGLPVGFRNKYLGLALWWWLCPHVIQCHSLPGLSHAALGVTRKVVS